MKVTVKMRKFMDVNGNSTLHIVVFQKGAHFGSSFIQTNGNLRKTHADGLGPHTLPELEEFVKYYGTPNAKRLFGRINLAKKHGELEIVHV